MSQQEKDYGKTLNLPKTDFAMRGNLPENEPKIKEKILDNNLYQKILKKNEKNTPFVLHDGPPYANGEIHLGHALNKTLKDVVNRYKMLQGFYTPYIPGYDTHGLPTEKRAIQVLGLNRDEISINKFRDTCKDFALKFIDKQTEGFKRLGILGDWDNHYATLNPEFEAIQIEVFGDMYKQGYIYKGLKPVYWCTDCETALAEAEIEYKEHKAKSIYVKFPVKDSQNKFEIQNTYFIIWTTTPWTLPGNVAIVVSEESEYSMVKVNEEKYILASSLVEDVMKISEIEDYEVIDKFKGKEFEEMTCKHPFLDRDSKVVLGSDDTISVELETGTGIVHCAPGYGKEDYLCGLKYDLDIVVTVDAKGYQTEEAGEFAGLFYDKSNQEIIQWLDKNGLLLKQEEINHQYPHCWRCKKPIIFRATNQWFASIEGFRKEAIEQIKNVKWVPSWGEDRITGMVRDRNDWCISRQRTWGVPLPIFYCTECGKEYVTEKSIEKIQNIFRDKGSNAWFDLSEQELMPEQPTCKVCGNHEFRKETDIMDVWFDSGSSHLSVLKQRNLPWPADLYLEGNDQYRGWFQSSLLISVATTGLSPYKEVVTHGFIIDTDGRKMSKSLGNGVNPQDVCKMYGADILRLWVVSSDFKSDITVSSDIMKQIAEVYRKIRNTARYILGNISDYNPEQPIKYENLLEIDKWALTRLNKLIQDCSQGFETYEFHNVYHHINQFCVTDMSNFYLDIIKDRLYTSRPDSILRRSAQTVMYEILNSLVKILAPFICFTAEEIWKYMPHIKSEQVESVMLSNWPKQKEQYNNKELSEKWENIIKLKELVSKHLELARENKIIGHSLNAKVILYANEENYEFLKQIEQQLKTVFIVSELKIEKNSRRDETEKIGVKVELATGEKCERCWMYSNTVGKDKANPTICERCSQVINN